VLRYRPNENVSLYGKWATGFKAGGFEMGQAQPQGGERYHFDEEEAMTWETGARGSFLDGRANANLTLFWTEYDGLQVTAVQTVDNVTSGRTTNAAKQRSRGAELAGRVLISDRTSLDYSAMLLDSKMVEYPGAVCSGNEQELNLCDPGPDNTIDRTGEPSRMAPNWQVSMQLDHWVPVFDQYKVSFNAKFIASDDYITDRNWSRVTTMHDSQDLNLTVGYGDRDDTWQVSAWARNIMANKVTYNPEFHLAGDGLLQQPLNSSNFMSYGLQLRYNYQ
jgi:outer membrane receptor protein involved in Fe transport